MTLCFILVACFMVYVLCDSSFIVVLTYPSSHSVDGGVVIKR